MTAPAGDPDVDVHVYVVPSAPETPGDCRDIAAVAADRRAFALCDGASSAYRAGDWAGLLSGSFSLDDPGAEPESVLPWLDACRGWWNDQAAARPASGGAVGQQFFQANAVARGSASTFLGVRLRWAAEGWQYTAAAVGDTCLFHVRGGHLLHAFPVTSAAAFDDRPDLVLTREEADGADASRLRTSRQTVRPGDELHLVTDALAQLLLTHGTPDAPDAALWWHVMGRLGAADFDRMVTRLRQTGEIETDDTTLVRVRFRS
ncbi:hypothetical protein [Actinacidiphila yeochonensis]|uniref:hypothetical protein n=1 Tax=Actinacidiphila yeochonensis TaxID=89050 RepID=UPI00068E9E20|nr:hypothetical protein [Actinacidiphila yeochonensis]